MRIKVSSIKELKEKLKRDSIENIKVIIISSYDNDIDFITQENKIVLHFEDSIINKATSFNCEYAKQINRFLEDIDYNKYTLYICCDSGESRSTAVAAAILRKYGEDEMTIWNNPLYHPNILVYKILCQEFKLKNNIINIKYRQWINRNALKYAIKKSRQKIRIFHNISISEKSHN
jgi:predicted protein tyrosine phosphatase